MTTAAIQQRDRLVRNVNDYAPRPGMGPLEVALREPGPNIPRLYLIPRLTESQEERRYPGPGNGELLCKGAALGLCDDGKARHIRGFNGRQKFVGFAEKIVDLETVLVRSRGSVELYVGSGAKPGDPVFCDDVDSFSVNGPGLCEIGVVLSLVPDRAGHVIVGFRAFDDRRGFDLDPTRSMRETGVAK